MKQRCNNPRAQSYQYYGLRGIRVLFPSFEDFVAEAGLPEPGQVIDRIDNDGHYAPGNVRWVSPQVNLRNRRPFKTPHQLDASAVKKIVRLSRRGVSNARLAELFKVSNQMISRIMTGRSWWSVTGFPRP